MQRFVRRLRPVGWMALLFWTALGPRPVSGQGRHASLLHRPEKAASVLMLSDLHFDPLSDPAKFRQLEAAPAAGWLAVLEEPASADQAAAFSSLQARCKARGVDSSWNLVRNSLQSARLRAAKATFAVVAGDLLVHGLDCRLRALAPDMTETQVSGFAEKTVAFLALQMRRLLPGMPVYLALGNNDSGCADYRETPGSGFLKSAGDSFKSAAASGPGVASAFESFSEYGDYSLTLPAPLQHARLIVLQNIFESERYATCGGKKLLDPDKGQMEWLREQLEKARASREHVWVMAHIPPGVDVYASFHKYVFEPARMCEVKAPTMFLHSDAITETLASYPDVIRLALFSHTHMDEVKLLHRAGADGGIASKDAVAAKLIPSISPVNGNHPAFLLAEVSATDAGMLDYATYTAGDSEGTQWTRTYSFRSTYGVDRFSATSVGKLTAGLREDRAGSSPVSRAYRQHFLPGDSGLIGLGLQQIWPAYSCAASETTPADFSRCLCPAKAEKAAPAATTQP